jgi:hypothetical protein
VSLDSLKSLSSIHKKSKMRTFFFLLIGATLIAAAGTISKKQIRFQAAKEIKIRGIYGSPEPFWKKNLKLNDLNVNAVFLHHNSINQAMINRAKTEGVKVFAEFATLNGKGYVDKHPEAWAIDNNGNKVEAATWFMGVCPSEPGFKKFRLDELRKLLRTFDVAGVWMDYVHWHAQFEDPEPILPETCFCEQCLAAFQLSSGVKLPEGATSTKADWILKNRDNTWRNWRCSVIAGWAREFKRVIKKEKPGALLGIYHCPWDDDDFNSARRRILGLDYDSLKGIIDVFSPMVYHGRMEKSPEWVKENIEWFSKHLSLKTGTVPTIWPIVQAHDDPNVISSEDFEKVLRYGTAGSATGVMMFTSNAVAEDASKTETMKKVYGQWVVK